MLVTIMTFSTIVPLKIKSQDGVKVFNPTDTFRTEKIDAVRGLMESGKIRPGQKCQICHEYTWWLSVYGVLRCGTCNPPATKDIVKKDFSKEMVCI